MRRRLSYAFVFTLILGSAAAQNNQVLYFMNLPQNHLQNPALKPSARTYIGIPALTGIDFSLSNNFIGFSDIFTSGTEVSENSLPFLDPDFNPETFLQKVKRLNYLEPRMSVQLIGLGLTLRNDFYVFLDINDRAEGNVVLPGDLLRLAYTGNNDFAGQTFDFSPLRADIKYYREIGIGFSKKVAPRLRIGAKGKLLFGVAAGEYTNETLDLTVNDNGSNSLVADLAIKVSGPVDFFLDPDMKLDDVRFDDSRFENRGWGPFLDNFNNPGFGVDLGAEFEVNSRIILSASVTDLGFIRWKSGITNMKGQGEARLKGIDFEDIRNGSATLDDLGENLADSLTNAIIFSKTADPFTTFLPFGFSIGGKFNVTDKFSVGLLSYSRNVDRMLKEALTLSANLNLSNILTTSLAYTAGNATYSSIGAGVGVRGAFTQFYFLVDRIPLKWSRIDTGDGSFCLPANWNTLHLRLGFNLVFGHGGVKKTENPETSAE